MRIASPAAPPTLRTVEDQLESVLASVVVLPTESVPVAGSVGRTLAEPVHARIDMPRFDNSAMDGFAARSEDVATASVEHPVTLRVIADLPAGSAEDPALAPGEAARIMTGAPVPSPATVIVPFEHTIGGLDGSETSAVVTTAPRHDGAHIRRRGEELREGAEIAPAGILVGPLQASAFAASGVERVVVHRRPRVAIISTGSELAAPGTPLTAGRVPESNSVLLATLCAETGAEIVSVDAVSDVDDDLRAALARALGEARADVVVTSGGVSAGAHEVVKNVLRDRIEFIAVAVQPGRPQAFGRIDDALVFGLPGNPASVVVSFEAFVRPALLALQGRTALQRTVIRVTASAGWRSPVGRRQYVPAVLDRSDPGDWSVRPAAADGSPGSHLVAGLARADAYAVVPADVSDVAAGDPVDVMLLS